MIHVFVTTVHRADLPQRLSARLVTRLIRAGPTDVMWRREPAELTNPRYGFFSYGHVIARHKRRAGRREVDALVTGTWKTRARPFVRNQRVELTRRLVTIRDGLQVTP